MDASAHIVGEQKTTEAPIPPASPRRAPGPDLLRFVAVSLVMFHHLPKFQEAPGDRLSWMENIARALQTGGWVGVDIFFVLSGFLVSGLIFDEWQRRGSVSIGRFLLRRGFKIYPSFWFFLITITALYIIVGPSLPGDYFISAKTFANEFFFLQNFTRGIFFHTWSLAVEEHFYLFLAGLMWLLLWWNNDRNPRRNPFYAVPFLFLCAAIACLGIRIVSNKIFVPPPIRYKQIFYATYLRMDSLFFGVLLAYLWRFRFTARVHLFLHRWRYGLIVSGVGALLPMFFFDPLLKETTWIRVYGFMFCYVGGGALLLGFLKAIDGMRSQPVRFFAFLGASSYPVYLWHWVAITLSSFVFSGPGLSFVPWIGHYLLASTLAWTIGILASRLVETPVLKFRDRHFPSLSSGAGTGTPAPGKASSHLQTVPVVDRL